MLFLPKYRRDFMVLNLNFWFLLNFSKFLDVCTKNGIIVGSNVNFAFVNLNVMIPF